MTRTTYVYRHGRVVPKHTLNEPPPETAHNIIPDIKPFTTAGDNVEIRSRSQLREYERRTGSVQIGNENPGLPADTWEAIKEKHTRNGRT